MTDHLQDEVRRLRRTVRILGAGLAATAAVVLIGAANGPADLKVRSLSVVDPKGVTRVVIAAPVPDPVRDGKPLKRAGVSSGVILYGPNGDERGGYITTEGDEGVLTIDALKGREMFKVVGNAAAVASLFSQRQNEALAA